MIVLALLIYLAQGLAGFMFLHLIWNARELKFLVFKFFLGAGAGAGISSLLYFLWCWVALPAQGYPFLELALFILLAILVWQKEAHREKITGWPVDRKNIILWGGLLLCALFFHVASFLIQATGAPHGYYDAWAIWNIGARYVYFERNSWLQAIPQDPWWHTDYPLLVTLNVANVWAILGTNLTRVPIIFSLIFSVSLIGLVFSSLLITSDGQQGALAAILVASLPLLAVFGSFQYADIQLSYFFLAATIFLYLYSVRMDGRLLLLAGFFAGLSAWTKNEGEIFVISTFLLCVALSFRWNKNLLKYFVPGLILPLLVVALFKSIAPPNDLFVDKAGSFQQLFDLSRYRLIVIQMGEKFSLFGLWPVSFWGMLVLYAFLVWKKPGRLDAKFWFPLYLILFQFAGYFVIYLITPHDLSWHLDTSLYRLIFHVFPLTVFWLFSLLPSPSDVFVGRPLVEHG